jgi:hypothetical protein
MFVVNLKLQHTHDLSMYGLYELLVYLSLGVFVSGQRNCSRTKI